MRKFILFLIISCITCGFFLSEAHAKRFGGGKSIGVQRSVSNLSKTATQPLQNIKQRLSQNKWLGPLAGLAAGSMLAYLFMGHGMGSGILSWLAIAGVVLLLMNLLRGRKPAMAAPQSFATPNAEMNTQAPFTQTTVNDAPAANDSACDLPNGQTAEALLREAKVQFIRLQTAYDEKNLSDIREFTTPEMYAEVQLQLEERGNAINRTEVIDLNAELLGSEIVFQQAVAEVKFSGMIREEPQSPYAAFTEIWHFKKPTSQSRWLVAGIQQVN